jgi:hypothetical protein
MLVPDRQFMYSVCTEYSVHMGTPHKVRAENRHVEFNASLLHWPMLSMAVMSESTEYILYIKNPTNRFAELPSWLNIPASSGVHSRVFCRYLCFSLGAISNAETSAGFPLYQTKSVFRRS